MTQPGVTNASPYDFHVHTKYLGCADATMEVAAIVKACERLGVTRLGITDHLNRPDQLQLHPPITADIRALDTAVEVYFGVELNFTGCDADFVFSPEIQADYGFQFAIGGIHNTYLDTYDLKRLVDIQHRHHLKTCADSLVDVLVHPYWFSYGEKHRFEQNGWPWFDTMKAVPEAYVRELGQVARETGTAIEINATANLTNVNFSKRYVEEYIEFLAILAEEGACFSSGSDAHTINRLADVAEAWTVMAKLNLPHEQIWTPSCPPLAGKSS